MNRRLVALYDMIRALNSETDPESLLASILDMALDVVNAERGMLLLRDSSESGLSVRLARNLERETIQDAKEFSRNIVREATSGKPVLAVDTGKDDRFADFKSVSLYGIHSVLCVPLRGRGRIVGAVYLDSRAEGALFSVDDLKFLEAFADHAALALENVRTRLNLQRDNQKLQVAAESRVQFDNMIGRCAAMQRVFDLILKVAPSNLAVLIQGESGTGKELVARAIHFHGPRRKCAFISENCAAIPETLLQSELFGHVRGAFSGAERTRQGLFEQADGGTLFLDEVGDMSPAMQAQLLRVLQEGVIRPVGGEQTITVDVRVLAATHRDLQEQVAAGDFREDLLYRLQVLPINLPPLRERPGDLPLLIDRLLERIAGEREREKPVLDPKLLELLEGYSWPGNVRQLENVLQRLVLLSGDGPLSMSSLELDPALGRQLELAASQPEEPRLSLEASERERIRQALGASKRNRTRAARMLGISRATLYRRIREFEL